MDSVPEEKFIDSVHEEGKSNRWHSNCSTDLFSESPTEPKEYQIEDVEALAQELNILKKTSLIETKIIRERQEEVIPFTLENLSKINSNRIVREDYLEKKVDQIFTNWKKRYCILTLEKLYCYTDENKIQVISCINFKLLPAEIKQQDRLLTLSFKGECQEIEFLAESFEKGALWKSSFELTILRNEKEKKIALKNLSKNLFQEKDALLEKQLLEHAETGDILLMKSENSMSALQRFVTSSEYDHIAMLVRFINGEVKIFEANQSNGVAIYQWEEYFSQFTNYRKVCYRKFQNPRKEDMNACIINFIKRTIGKQYELSLSKLTKQKSDMFYPEDEKQRGYFCSELIAKALKNGGFLDEEKSSARYWPIDFTQKGELFLKNGAYFEAEQLVILKKHIKNR